MADVAPVPRRGGRRSRTDQTAAAVHAVDAALGRDDRDFVVLEAAATPKTYGRRRGPREHNALVASARRLDLKDKRAIADAKRRRQAWQTEAWDYYDEVGEIGYTVDFTGNLMSKIRLFAAARPDPDAPPVPVDDPESGVDPRTAALAKATLERLTGCEGGQAALVRELTTNFEVAAECYLHGHEDPDTGEEDWQIRSIDELVVIGDRFMLRAAPGSNLVTPIPDDDLVVRMWIRHPRFSSLATCAMRRVISEAEALLLLSREIRATAKSRLSAGILAMPSELSFGGADPTRDEGDGEEPDDPFLEDLFQAMTTPIQEEGSANAVVPLVVTGPGEILQYIRHIELSKQLDPTLDARIEGRVMRVARGLNMPVEVTTGLQETTFANAAQVKKSEWDAHGEPRAITIVDALTAGYYQPALEEAGIDRVAVRDLFIWFDPNDAISAPDPTDTAEKDHEDGIISDEARRRLHGHSEADAPDDQEILRRILFKSSRIDPDTYVKLLDLTGLAPGLEPPPKPVPPAFPPPNRPAEPDAPPAATQDEEPAPAPAETAAGRPRLRTRPNPGGLAVGRALISIERDLRTRIQIAASEAVNRAIEKAGARLRSKAGRNRSGDASTIRQIIASTKTNREIPAALGPFLVAALGETDDSFLLSAFDDLAAQFEAWTAAARAQALRIIERAYGELEPRTRDLIETGMEGRIPGAWAVLQDGLTDLAKGLLYNPSPGAPVLGETDPTVTVPVGLVRTALSIAGGSNPVDTKGVTSEGDPYGIGTAAVEAATGGPVPGLATGPDVLAAATTAAGADEPGADAIVEAYQWDYGAAPRQSFEPHELLDGTIVETFDDDNLANDEGWPDVDFFFPGDHAGCVCDFVPVFVIADTLIVPEVEPALNPDLPEE